MACPRLLLPVLVLSTLLAVTLAEEDGPRRKDQVQALTSKTFPESYSERPFFVMFYAPWCGHCKKLKPDWEKLADEFNLHGNKEVVVIAKVDCTVETELCSKHGVTGYPTLKFFNQDIEETRYKGARDLASLKAFIAEQTAAAELATGEDGEGSGSLRVVRPGLVELDEASFETALKVKEKLFVKFYAPWCGHCKALAPDWEKLAKTFENDEKVLIAKVDCTTNGALCKKYDVRGYPTLLWFSDGEKTDKYPDARQLDKLTQYVNNKKGVTKPDKEETDGKVPSDVQKPTAVKGLYELNGANFDVHVAEGFHLIKFYAPWCGHCKKLAPVWDELAEHYASDKKVKISKIDCTDAANKATCTKYEVKGYPTLLYFSNGEMKDKYQSGRDLEALKTYIEAQREASSGTEGGVKSENGLLELDSSNFDKQIEKGQTFVKFYAPWCGHCKKLAPVWAELAEKFQENENVNIAKVDCTTNNVICSKYEVKGYPTLAYFKNGKLDSPYGGGRDLASLEKFVQTRSQVLEAVQKKEEKAEAAAADAEVIDDVTILTKDNFDSTIAKGYHFVKFYAPWCGHCKRLAPVWIELAGAFKSNSAVSIDEFDCTTDRETCTKHGVSGYPTLIWFKDGKKASDYKQGRDLDSLKKFVNEKIGGSAEAEAPAEAPPADQGQVRHEGVHPLTEKNFKAAVSRGITFVKFYAPWCGHCKRLAPTWDELSNKFAATKEVKIAKIDCTVEKKVCGEYEVKGYPTLILFNDGEKQEKYSGPRELEDLSKYVLKHLGAESLGADGKVAKKEAGPGEVISLDTKSFTATVAEGATFVKFYAPWCGHCKKLAPTWDELAKKYENNDKVKIAKVDCTEFQELCGEHEVKGFPTLILFNDGKKKDKYQGGRELNTMATYMEKNSKYAAPAAAEEEEKPAEQKEAEKTEAVATEGVLALDSNSFKTTVATGSTFVKFYAPWCGHCKRLAPTWEELAGKYNKNNNIKIAKVDCTVEKELCGEYEVKGFPTLILFKNGEKQDKYQGGRDLTTLANYINARVPHDEL